MYIRLINGAPERYSLRALAADHPEVSFPDVPAAELLAAYDIYPLTRAQTPEHNPLTQILREGVPVQEEGEWVLGWEVETLNADQAAQTIRAARDRQLAQTDWIIMKGLVSRKLWKFPGGALRACEGSVFQAARSRGMGSRG